MNYVTVVTPEFDTDQAGRNPELTGIPHDIYMFVREHPGCSRRDITKALGLRWNSATARVKHMIDAGLLMENGTVMDTVSKKRVRALFAPTDFQHKAPRDRVRVIVKLIVDEKGNYHAAAEVVDERITPKKVRRHTVMTKEITLIAPYPNEYRSMFIKDKVAVVTARDTMANAKLIIEG